MVLIILPKDRSETRAFQFGEASMKRAFEVLEMLQGLATQTIQPGKKPNAVHVYLVPKEHVGTLTKGDASVLANGISTYIGKANLWMTAKELVEYLEIAIAQRRAANDLPH